MVSMTVLGACGAELDDPSVDDPTGAKSASVTVLTVEDTVADGSSRIPADVSTATVQLNARTVTLTTTTGVFQPGSTQTVIVAIGSGTAASASVQLRAPREPVLELIRASSAGG